jgi:hypothetical protein
MCDFCSNAAVQGQWFSKKLVKQIGKLFFIKKIIPTRNEIIFLGGNYPFPVIPPVAPPQF